MGSCRSGCWIEALSPRESRVRHRLLTPQLQLREIQFGLHASQNLVRDELVVAELDERQPLGLECLKFDINRVAAMLLGLRIAGGIEALVESLHARLVAGPDFIDERLLRLAEKLHRVEPGECGESELAPGKRFL